MSAMVAVIHTAAGVTAGRYTTAAAITVVLYDILITLGDEVALVWPTSLSLVKVLYLMNRYIAIPCLLVGAYHVAALRAAPSVSVSHVSFEHGRTFDD
ncbi:hypothetical protein FRC14_005274 [Serendipita sp. 396]|nr:hypothetical protein FRC14_005274 [Serendipita sp. 396]KAG8786654.1 hypothetical protein FRC15_010994 [Serendipita sp. 397]KAG8869717.1 hypothetical protein FRC20_001041 [Serendipita sp. 405]